MAKRSFSRRGFLKLSALSSSTFFLSSCSSLDRYFMGDKRDLSNEVVILGGGAAGLAAAFALKKRKVPYRVFEASSRIGGRVQSVTLFPGQGPVAEMGAEFFEDQHRLIFDLAKELNLPVKEIKTQGALEAHLWIVGIFLTRPFRQMPWFFTFAFDSWTSLRRLEDFFATQNNQTPEENWEDGEDNLAIASEKWALEAKNLRLSIGKKSVLKNISMKVAHGELIAIVGEVGSGKSLLLLSLLGETGASFEDLQIDGKDALHMSVDELRAQFAYVPQEGFIMSASLRENVAFLYDIEPELDPNIEESLKLAQFDLTTERVEDGLNTEIGERGVNLSGGQRQRVGLARVHYHNAPVLLLDDCLSAVDVDTEQRLFDELLMGAWKGRTRIMVTHRLTTLARVDRIFFLKEGQLIDHGRYEELLTRNAEFREYTMSVAKESVSV
jgi:ATP-binding cassette subfamily B multidrug efflux pump